MMQNLKEPFLYIEKKECCGCGACESVCPSDAIIMKTDEEGFEYPHINKQKCIKCLKCERVCAFSNAKDYTV